MMCRLVRTQFTIAFSKMKGKRYQPRSELSLALSSIARECNFVDMQPNFGVVHIIDYLFFYTHLT